MTQQLNHIVNAHTSCQVFSIIMINTLLLIRIRFCYSKHPNLLTSKPLYEIGLRLIEIDPWSGSAQAQSSAQRALLDICIVAFALDFFDVLSYCATIDPLQWPPSLMSTSGNLHLCTRCARLSANDSSSLTLARGLFWACDVIPRGSICGK